MHVYKCYMCFSFRIKVTEKLIAVDLKHYANQLMIKMIYL